MAAQNVKCKYEIGDEVYHTGYLSKGTIKDITKNGSGNSIYLIEWVEAPLKGSTLYFAPRDISQLDVFRLLILQANNKSLRETIKKYSNKVIKRRTVFSAVDGKIIQD